MPQQRCLTRGQAAAYCGLTSAGFTAWCRQGIVPGPIPGTKRWDRKALDAALDKASGMKHADADLPDPFEAWKHENGYAS